MTARAATEPVAPGVLEPAAPGADAFVDALLGLDRLCDRLAATLDSAAVDGEAPSLRGGAPGDGFDDVRDAVLGAMSMRTTLSLVLGALVGEPAAEGGDSIAEAAGDASIAWSREQLR